MDSAAMSSMRDDEDDDESLRLPLLLNPAYARTKSTISDELRNFRLCLKWCLLDHSTSTGAATSYVTFAFLAVLLPPAVSLSLSGPSVSLHQLVQLPSSALAAIAFFSLAASFRRQTGLRQFLLLDGALRDDPACVRRRYARLLDRAFRRLLFILLPCFAVEVAHKIQFFSAASVRTALWSSPAALVATLASWVYRTGVFLLVCVLFRLTCELQTLRFEGLYEMFEEEGSGASPERCEALLKEHARIRRQLLVTSHRYRIFILGCLVTITVSQLGALLLVLASKSEKNFFNSGDVVVCSAVQLSGMFMCLMGAAKITHRAQRVVSVASRWHAVLSASSATTSPAKQSPSATDYASDSSNPKNDDSPEPSTNHPIASQGGHQKSTFQARQALVMYLQHNGGGITLFGFALDRGMLHTLFAFETTLVLWILSKVVVLS
ncbi:uncharacterized protein LOC121968363 [Zingiber officinale]|uniref:uncharacterized protein LOC121968363 n=1 Tax=Zingiber officinale TaxID=94328 RepID=UPI001C4AE6D9|nr:uncharacterized protein LOC121968363 [Zingiber officinale]